MEDSNLDFTDEPSNNPPDSMESSLYEELTATAAYLAEYGMNLMPSWMWNNNNTPPQLPIVPLSNSIAPVYHGGGLSQLYQMDDMDDDDGGNRLFDRYLWEDYPYQGFRRPAPPSDEDEDSNSAH